MRAGVRVGVEGCGEEEGVGIPAIHPGKVEADPPCLSLSAKASPFPLAPVFLSSFLLTNTQKKEKKKMISNMQEHPRFKPASAPPPNRVHESHAMSPGWLSLIELNEIILVAYLTPLPGNVSFSELDL